MSSLGLIQDGSVLVEDGKITHVGPTRRVENLAAARDAMEIDATGRVVMPAFVDARTELLRACGNGEHSPAHNIRSLEQRAQRLVKLGIRHGTVSFEVRAGCGDDDQADVKFARASTSLERATGARIVTAFGPPCVLPQPGEGEADNHRLSMIPRVAARFQAACFDSSALRPGTGYRSYLDACRAHGLPLKLTIDHADDAEMLAPALAYSPMTIEGLNHLDAAGAAMVASSNSIAVLLPALTFGNEGPRAPGRLLIDRGAGVALATGFRHGGPRTLSMQAVIALASIESGLTLAEAITASTINAAHAIGAAASTGSLQHGKDADILIVDAPDHRELLSGFGANLSWVVMRRGRILHREGV